MYPYPSLVKSFADHSNEPLWIGLDPGTTKTGWVVFNPKDETVLHAGHDPNEFVMNLLECGGPKDKIIMECFAAQGMPLGESSIETVRWEGRFIERARTEVCRISRREIKILICNSARAKDANIRQALVDMFAYGYGNHGYGTKAEPSPLRCLKGSGSHGFSALAVCVAHSRR
tara:strand:+ start:43 stop:561 length:519 start_codon:yes stop_codon:yes gene_type:complete